MDIQARRCINCRAYSETNECALHPKWEPIDDPKNHWCLDGRWFRWDGKQWQEVFAVDNCLDMKVEEVVPIGRAVDTSMVVTVVKPDLEVAIK